MKTKPHHDIIEYFVASGHAPDQLQSDLKAAIKKHASAYQVTSDALDDIDIKARALDELERKVIDDVASWKNDGEHSLDVALKKLGAGNTALKNAKEIHDLAQRIERRTLSNINAMWSAAYFDRLTWVARYRTIDIHAVGLDAVPVEVRNIYKELAILWSPRIDPSLDLDIFRFANNTAIRLPLTWGYDFTDLERASLAWWWLQVADGNIRVLSDIRDNGKIRITKAVDVLPSVPAAPIAYVRPSRVAPQW